MNTNCNEVARMRQQIEDEVYSMRLAMYGPAIVAKHEIIQRKYTSFGERTARLAELIGKQEANQVAGEIYVRVMDSDVKDGGKVALL